MGVENQIEFMKFTESLSSSQCEKIDCFIDREMLGFRLCVSTFAKSDKKDFNSILMMFNLELAQTMY